MWIYEKKLQYPVKIKNPNANYAKIIISQLGGADGELAASMHAMKVAKEQVKENETVEYDNAR